MIEWLRIKNNISAPPTNILYGAIIIIYGYLFLVPNCYQVRIMVARNNCEFCMRIWVTDIYSWFRYGILMRGTSILGTISLTDAGPDAISFTDSYS